MPAIRFEPMGIGDLLRDRRLVVPPNQRSYAWEERHVRELLQDLNASMTTSGPQGGQEYFLGTIVLVNPDDGKPSQISDGQQRLATTTIVLARIRDIYESLGESARASSVQTDYITKIDLDTAEKKAHLTMNTEDNAFFLNTILGAHPHAVDETKFMRASNRRLLGASREAFKFLTAHISGFPPELRAQQLLRWVKFLKERSHIIAVTVPDENQAFRLFETLNDRGVKASQVDILKKLFPRKIW